MGKKGVLIVTMIAGIAVMMALSSVPAYAVHGGNNVQLLKNCDPSSCTLYKDINDDGICGVITEKLVDTMSLPQAKMNGITNCNGFNV